MLTILDVSKNARLIHLYADGMETLKKLYLKKGFILNHKDISPQTKIEYKN